MIVYVVQYGSPDLGKRSAVFSTFEQANKYYMGVDVVFGDLQDPDYLCYAIAPLAIRQIFFAGIVRTSRLHRHLSMDRSRAPAFHCAFDQPHLARLRQPGDPASPPAIS